ncbi:hypothetical protein BFZC1_02597 [Lysinibacillus fusiformis ZC1]|nr:hypothetical protein BFZC1_02597 [Lysinibacillus fusiformis ZC1]
MFSVSALISKNGADHYGDALFFINNLNNHQKAWG